MSHTDLDLFRTALKYALKGRGVWYLREAMYGGCLVVAAWVEGEEWYVQPEPGIVVEAEYGDIDFH